MAPPVRVDSRGLACPLPVLRLRKALLGCAPGEQVELLATDLQTARDVPAFCAETGDRLVAQHDGGGILCFVIERTTRSERP